MISYEDIGKESDPRKPELSKMNIDDMIPVLSEEDASNVRRRTISGLGDIDVKDKTHVIKRLKEQKAILPARV
jgi:hypothetical protein